MKAKLKLRAANEREQLPGERYTAHKFSIWRAESTFENSTHSSNVPRFLQLCYILIKVYRIKIMFLLPYMAALSSNAEM